MGEQQPLLQQKQDASDRDTSEDNDFDAKWVSARFYSVHD